MPHDLSDLLAEGAPRDPGRPDLDAIESRAARRRTGRIGASFVGVLVAAAIGVGAWPSTPEPPIIDEVEEAVPGDDGTTVLPLPDPGSVLPSHANGRPVFVVHDEDGDVRVLDAIGPHDSDPAAMKVLTYCRTSGWFEDPWHDSKFSDNGAWVGGPAPYGLATHDVIEIDDDTVTVGGLDSAPARGVLEGAEARGPSCSGLGEPEQAQPDDLVLHTDVTDDLVPGLRYPERPDDECCGYQLPEEPQVAVGGDPVTVVVPASDEIAARHIGDRPAFIAVTTLDSGDTSVMVLDAVDPHQTWFGPPKVLTICTAATLDGPASPTHHAPGVVYDPWYLSQFSPVGLGPFSGVDPAIPPGGWIGGPAPHGLSRFPVLDVRTTSGGATEVDVLPGVLPAPPRIDDGLGQPSEPGPADVELDDLDPRSGNVPQEQCHGRDELFPDMPPADASLLDDLILHEPLHPDLWWYPTPARLLGDEPGLPPEELQRYLDRVTDGATQLDLMDLPSLGAAGLAVQRPSGVELTELDGTSLGIVLGAELVDDPRDGHGGAILLRDAAGAEYWVAPSNGTTAPAAGLTVAGGYLEQSDGTWVSDDGFLPPLEGPLHVGNQGRHVTGPRCEGEGCPTPTVVDLDMGGIGTTDPGCVATDGFGDLNALEVCFGTSDVGSAVVGRFVDGDQRWEVPRYEGQPADIPTIGRFRDALFGPRGVLAQLSLECEIPAVVLLEDGSGITDPWGADTWEGGPTSTLLGSTLGLDEDGGFVPLAQVAAGACGDAKGVREGVWALSAEGPQHLNDITAPAVVWDRFTADLSAVVGDAVQRQRAALACADPDADADETVTVITDIDLDEDGRDDRVLLEQDVIACLADGARASYETPPVEFATVADLGTGADVLAVGGTLISSTVSKLLLWLNERLTPIRVGCLGSCIPDEPARTTFEDGLLGGGQGSATWGCRATGDGVTFLTVRAEHDDGEVTVTTVEYELSGATLDEVDRTITTRDDDGTEFVALDHLRDLGATRYCET